MITILEPIADFDPFDAFLGYQPQNCLFFDIETTGFSPSSSTVFLIGAVFFTPDGWQFAQYMAEHPDEEKELVASFFSLAAQYKTLIHFNGATFDIPYLAQKADDYNLENPFPSMESIDLYQKFRPLKKLLALDRMNQTSLEVFLQYHREDKLTGKHMISLFQKYAASKERGIRDLLLLHNHDDLIGMTQILRLCVYLMLPEEIADVVSFARCRNSISACSEKNSAYFEYLSETSVDHFELTFRLKAKLPMPFDYTIDALYHLTVQGAEGKLTIPAYLGEMCYFFPDYKNYYYLPLEDQAIHKSVGAYVDKEHRTAAKPQNCYVRKTGLFLPQPEVIFEPSFRQVYADKQLYFEYTDSLEHKPSLENTDSIGYKASSENADLNTAVSTPTPEQEKFLRYIQQILNKLV